MGKGFLHKLILVMSGYDGRGENAPFFVTESSLLLKQISFRKYSFPPPHPGNYCRFLQPGSLVLYCAPHTTAVAVVSRFPEPAAEPPCGVPRLSLPAHPRRARLPLTQRRRCLAPAGGLVCAAGPAGSPFSAGVTCPLGRC